MTRPSVSYHISRIEGRNDGRETARSNVSQLLEPSIGGCLEVGTLGLFPQHGQELEVDKLIV